MVRRPPKLPLFPSSTLFRSPLPEKGQPFGAVPAAILFGGLRAGASRMQFVSQIPIDIISIVQALVLVFVAAPEMVRWLYRLRPPGAELPPEAVRETQVAAGWGRAE